MKPAKIARLLLLAALTGPGLATAAGDHERGQQARAAGHQVTPGKPEQRGRKAYLGHARQRPYGHRGYRHDRHRHRRPRLHRHDRIHERRLLRPYRYRYRHHYRYPEYGRGGHRHRGQWSYGYGISFELDGIRYRFGEYGLR